MSTKKMLCSPADDFMGLDDSGATLVGDDELAGFVGSALPLVLGLAAVGLAGYWYYVTYVAPKSAATSGWGLATVEPSASLRGPQAQLVGRGIGIQEIQRIPTLAEGASVIGGDGPPIGGLDYAAAVGAPVSGGLHGFGPAFGGTVFGNG